MRIDVAASLTVDSPAPATALLQIAVASPAEELLTVISGGEPLEPEEFEVDGARVHRLWLGAGATTGAYAAPGVGGGPAPRRSPTPPGWRPAGPRPGSPPPSGRRRCGRAGTARRTSCR